MNVKQEKFCLEYLVDGNATRAAAAAGYSAKSARVVGSRLLTYADIKNRIESMRQEANNSAENDVFATFKEKRIMLKSVINDPEMGIKDRLKAIEIDNTMAGDNAPQRMDIESGGEPIRPVINFVKKTRNV